MRIQSVEKEKEEEEETVEKRVETKVYFPKEKDGNKDEKMILTTQYLLDKVLGAVSEARFNMKTKGTEGLRPLIDELKGIYSKGNYESLLTK